MKETKSISRIIITLICILIVFVYNFETSFGDPEDPNNPPANEEPVDPAPEPTPDNPGNPGTETTPNNNTDNSVPEAPGDNDNGNAGTDDEEKTAEDNPAEDSGTPKLKSLSISCGDLVPSFSPEIKEYKVYAKDGNKNCKIEADAGDKNIDIDGKDILTDKFQTSKVKVKSGNGDESTYTINIIRVDKCDFFEDNNLFYVNNIIKKKNVLSGYSAKNIKYKGEKIVSLVSNNNRMKFVNYINENNRKEKRWYLIKESDKSLQRSKVVKLGKQSYFAIDGEGKVLYGLYNKRIGFIVIGKDNKVSFYSDDTEHKDPSIGYSIYLKLFTLIGIALIVILFAIHKLMNKKKKDKKNKFSINSDDLI